MERKSLALVATVSFFIGSVLTGSIIAKYDQDATINPMKATINLMKERNNETVQNWNVAYDREVKDKNAWRAAYYSLSNDTIMYSPQTTTEYKSLVFDWHRNAFQAYGGNRGWFQVESRESIARLAKMLGGLKTAREH